MWELPVADERLYKMAPGPNQWVTYDGLIDELWEWSMYRGSGAPAITISKREEEPES